VKEYRAVWPAATVLDCCELSVDEKDGATTDKLAGVEMDGLKKGSPP
jgi:hypothetical protein